MKTMESVLIRYNKKAEKLRNNSQLSMSEYITELLYLRSKKIAELQKMGIDITITLQIK